MAGISLDLSGFEQWARKLGHSLTSMDFTRPLRSARQAIVSSTKENFAGGHAPDETAWPALRHGRPGSRQAGVPLRDKGLLMASIISAGRGHVEVLTQTTLVVGTNLEYAALHQHGGTITPKRGKYLTIPQTREAARAGGARNFPRPLALVLGTRGGVLLERKVKGKGKRQRVEEIVQYILTKRVVVPARPFLGFGDRLVERITTIFRDHLAKKLKLPGTGG